jgi:hypothetical protein
MARHPEVPYKQADLMVARLICRAIDDGFSVGERQMVGKTPALMARSSARTVRPSLSDDPKGKLAAALAALGYAGFADSTEFRRAPLYYDECLRWFEGLSEDDQETCRTLVDVIASAHKGAAEGMAASLPPAPRRPL